MKGKKNFFINEEGVVSIEFSLTVIIFLFLIFFVAEMARMAYTSAVIDLAISESAKSAKNAPSTMDEGYSARFNKRLTQQGGKIWGFLNKSDVISVQVTFSNSVRDMIATGGQSGNGSKKSLARYKLLYKYKPMFFPFPQSIANTLFDREVIFVQEYERSLFME